MTARLLTAQLLALSLSIAACSSSGGGEGGGGAGAGTTSASSSSVGAGGDGGTGGSGGAAASSSATGLSPNMCPTPAPRCLTADDEDINCSPSCGAVDPRCVDICNGGPPAVALDLGTTRIRVPSSDELGPTCCQNDVGWSMVLEPPAGHCIAVYGPTNARIAFGQGILDRCAGAHSACSGTTSDVSDHRAISIALPKDSLPRHGSVFTIDVTSAPCAMPDCSMQMASCNGDGAPAAD